MQWWEEFVAEQEKELGKSTVDKWLRPLKVVRFEKSSLYLSSSDPFHSLWFHEHARDKLLTHLHKWGHKRLKIHISHVPFSEKRKRSTKKKSPFETDTEISAPFQLFFEELDPLLTREKFFVTRENEVSCKILDEMIGYDVDQETYITPETPFGTYNPIYFYGKQGSGKTHLLMAIGHAAEVQGLRPLYVRAETFVDHVVAAIRAGQMSQFRQAYRSVDLLLIDDIDVFSRKGSTQEELFHTFNTLHLAGKQIVLSAHCAPNELQMIEPRLVSRFEWGIVLYLPTPEKKDRISLIKTKTEALQFPLPSRLVDLLIELFPSSPKTLVQALETLVLRSQLHNISSPQNLLRYDVEHLLQDLLDKQKKAMITPEHIIRHVTEYFGIRYEDIFGKAQTREFALPRQLAMYLCRTQLHLPYMKIGEILSRDHSTVMTSVQSVQNKLDQHDREVANAHAKICHRLKP